MDPVAPSKRAGQAGHDLASHPRRHPAEFSRAMTLVEVLAVLVILGLLAGTLAVGFSGAFARGKRELAKAAIGIVQQKLEAYRLEHDAWPGPELGLAALTIGHASPSDSYFLTQDQLLDPWGRPLMLIVPGPHGHPYEIISFGADGQPGGDGEDADLSSANLRAGDRRGGRP